MTLFIKSQESIKRTLFALAKKSASLLAHILNPEGNAPEDSLESHLRNLESHSVHQIKPARYRRKTLRASLASATLGTAFLIGTFVTAFVFPPAAIAFGTAALVTLLACPILWKMSKVPAKQSSCKVINSVYIQNYLKGERFTQISEKIRAAYHQMHYLSGLSEFGDCTSPYVYVNSLLENSQLLEKINPNNHQWMNFIDTPLSASEQSKRTSAMLDEIYEELRELDWSLEIDSLNTESVRETVKRIMSKSEHYGEAFDPSCTEAVLTLIQKTHQFVETMGQYEAMLKPLVALGKDIVPLDKFVELK